MLRRFSTIQQQVQTCSRFYALSVTANLCGQPFPRTHPHLFKGDHLDSIAVGGFDKHDFERRRKRFADQMHDNSIAFIQSADRHMMTNDIPYPYRQNSDFYYMTGFIEPGACLVIEKYKSDFVQYTLFVRPKNDYREKWDGPRTGVEKTRELLGMNVLEDKLALKLLEENDYSHIYIEPSMDQYNDPSEKNYEIRHKISEYLRKNKNCKGYSHRRIMDELRKIKDVKDVAMLEKAALISSHAFKAAMSSTRPGLSEAHIEAILEFEARLHGAQRLGYPPVVAGGNHANIIHYVMNNQILNENDLLLVDAGSEYHGYSSDITRTWPVSGKFSKSHRMIYEAVLRIQMACIQELQRGNFKTMQDLQNFSVQRTRDEIYNLGGFSSSFIRSHSQQVQTITELLYPHSIGHPMGMDIHENLPKFEQQLTPGMVITVEPGLYIPKEMEHDDRLPASWHDYNIFGIGVRIEDNILITSDGARVITKDTPKTIEEIEHIMADRKSVV